VNLRYMGFVLHRLEVGQFSEAAVDCYLLVLVEAIARVLKNLLRAELRTLMFSLKVPLVAPYRQLVVSYLNRVFGDHPSFESAAFWSDVVAKELRDKFSFAPLSSVFFSHDATFAAGGGEEATVGVGVGVTSDATAAVGGLGAPPVVRATSQRRRSLRLPSGGVGMESAAQMDARLRSVLALAFRGQAPSVRFLLFRRLRDLCGLHFTKTMEEKIHSGRYYNAQTPFDILDLVEIVVLVKHTPIVTNAEGTFYHMKAMAAFKARFVWGTRVCLCGLSSSSCLLFSSSPPSPSSFFL
jgi:hypothetical protein